MKADELNIGQHFWALMDKRLVVIGKFKEGYYVCGGWECSISVEDFEVVELIPVPTGCEQTEMYY